MYNKKYEVDEVDEFLSEFLTKPKKRKELIIDEDIKNRLNPLSEVEYENLKNSLLKNGCIESLIIWNNIIVDGHARYEICKEYDIEYTTIKKNFKSKIDVLKWIDLNQISRRNINEKQKKQILQRIRKENNLKNN